MNYGNIANNNAFGSFFIMAPPTTGIDIFWINGAD